WWALGNLVSILLTGFTWEPAAPLGVNVLIMVSFLVYVYSVAWVFNEQNQRLWVVKQSVERANVVFQSMLNLSELSDRTDSFESLVKAALSELQILYPERSFGFVLQDPQQSAFHFSAFTQELSATQQAEIMQGMTAKSNDVSADYVISTGADERDCVLYALPERFGQYRGFLVVQGPTLTDADQTSLKLLVKQLGTTIANKLLTMELKSAAERDALTGILNRGSLDLELEKAQARFRANNAHHFAVLLIDLIGLKSVNDQYGHEAGDAVICASAKALQSTCREQDLLFRFGGDEFVVLCQGETSDGAESLLRRIREQVHGRQVAFVTGDGVEHTLTTALSVGLASTDQVEPERVMPLADERMYQHKQAWYRDKARRQQETPGDDGHWFSSLG
ncbi:MAG: GGDEF domain-containing protein, partial [Natronospirillum sp.]